MLLSIVATDLGPALRDAVAALLITPARVEYRRETYSEECEGIIHRYEALPRGDGGLASARGLAADAVVALVRANRSVQFFIDDFAACTLPELHKIHPDAAGSLTATERRRVARALLRHQVLARIDTGPEAAVIHKFCGLFRPWETHQLADAHSLLCNMVSRAFFYYRERSFPW